MSPSYLSGLIMQNQNSLPLAQRRIQPIRNDNLLVSFTTEFRRLWDSTGTNAKPAAFWRPTPAPDLLPGYFPLGDVVASGHDNINEKRMVMVVCEADAPSSDSSKGPALRAPVDFEQVWSDAGSRTRTGCTIWRPVPPTGYLALGELCSMGRDKPLPSEVRCVRQDLVIASSISAPIWNDKGSGARQAFSAWGIYPPTAMAGEIICAPGTFIGVGTYIKPSTHATAYALRLPIPLEINSSPIPPELSDTEHPAVLEPAKVTQTAKLPWFVIRDPNLSPLEQLRTTPFYYLERTDQYVLLGYGKNDSEVNRTFRWIAQRPQSLGNVEVFTRINSIVINSHWPVSATSLFSARLSESFTLTESASGWNGPAQVEVATIVAKNRAVAAYELQSTYRLLRENRTQVPCELYYIDGNSLHLTQYSLAQASGEISTPSPEINTAQALDNFAAEDESEVSITPESQTGSTITTDIGP